MNPQITEIKLQRQSCLSIWWYLVLISVGLVLIVWNCQLPGQMQRLSSRVRPDAWVRLCGMWLVWIVITTVFISHAISWMHKSLVLNGEDAIPDRRSRAYVGISESIMYPAAILIGKPEFIGFWIAIKVAGNWIQWTGEGAITDNHFSPDEKANSENKRIEKVNEGRRRFNRFLVGNALSIVMAYFTYASWKIWVLN